MRTLIWCLCSSALAAAQESAPAPTFGTTVVIPSGLRGEVYLIRDRSMILPAFERRQLKPEGAIWTTTDQLVIDNDCHHPPAVRAAYVTLGGGIHRIRVPFFQGPRDCVALILAVAGTDRRWRVFSTDDFKPPSNPEEWKFEQKADSVLRVEGDDAPPKVNDLLRALGEKAEASAETGCIAYPVRDCGQ
jgi:hypothetical protein